MRFEDDYKNQNSSNTKILLGCLGTTMFFAVILGMVFFTNQDKMPKKHSAVSVSDDKAEKKESDDDFKLSGNTKTADELDFWHMYDDNEADVSQKENLNDPDRNKKDYAKPVSDNDVKGVSESEETISGNKFDAGDTDDTDYVEIFDSIPKHNYVSSGFRQEGNELQYYASNRKISSYGISVSKYQGNIDWELVKESGIDFAMIRMGVRGYSTGNVVLDEKFVENVEGALRNGIDVGIYFYSQATTIDEAVEEANYAVAAAAKYPIAYPVVFYTETIEQDSARTDSLNADELTAVASKFCEVVAGYGYRPMIGGSKKQLSKKLDISQLTNYDTWLLDAPSLKNGKKLSMSAYPYQYTMWQYSTEGHIGGIEGNCDLSISFVDYRYR